MVTVKDVLKTIRAFAPEEFEYKKTYDNIGLMVGDEDARVTKVLCCLDCTENVIDEAIAIGANLIVSHHPLIWNPLKSVTANDLAGRKILKAAANSINIYSAHTNLDYTFGGINDYVAEMLGLMNVKYLEPYESDGKELGCGRVGELSNKITAKAFKNKVKTFFKDDLVRIVGKDDALIKRVAVVNGGGGGDTQYVDYAIKCGADCLVTADVKHHVALYAKECNIVLIEPQHFNMEYVYISRLIQILKIETKSSKLDLEILQAATETSPRTL